MFDGVCNLCNRWVNFVIRNDKKKVVLFDSLQSQAGHKILLQHNLSTSNFESLVYIKNNKALLKSTAVLYLMKDIGGIWKIFFVFIIVPKFLRDFVYMIVAKNRYRCFGKKNTCMLPTSDLADRFLSNVK